MLQRTYADALSSEATEAIVERAGGNPLYVEELAKMVIETLRRRSDNIEEFATGPASAVHDPPMIPDTLRDLLMARLDRLGTAKEVAQLAAVIGREVPLDLLRRVSALAPADLQAAIDQLVNAGIFFTHRTALLFKHALIQDAAYQSLLRTTLRQHHSRIADELVAGFPEVTSTRPEVVARHYTEARRPIEATDFWMRAGKRALECSANVEAIAYAESGLVLVDQIRDEQERNRAELGLQLVLGPSLMASRGYADPSMEKAYGRARELCRHLGDPPALFPVMFGLWTFHCVRARHGDAAAIAHDMTALAQRDHNDALLLEADVTAGITHFYVGELAECRTRLERTLRLYDPGRDSEHCLIYGQDPRAASLAHLMLARWTLGDVDAALAAAADAVRLVRDITHPFSIVYALSFTAWLYRLRGDATACREFAERAIEVSGGRTLAVFLAISEILQGSALVSLGEHGRGIERLNAGFERFTSTASTLILPFWCCLRAQAYAEVGRVEDGLGQITEAIERIQRSGERHGEAEAYRTRAVLRKAAGSPAADVEADLRHAIAVARSQGAASWQLRSAITLCESLADTTRRQEGVVHLREARSAFAPGSAEPDVLAADALLRGM